MHPCGMHAACSCARRGRGACLPYPAARPCLHGAATHNPHRGFLADSDVLTFVTDRRSRKVAEVAANPAAEVCWYFPTSREQYRIAGELKVVTAEDLDQKLLQVGPRPLMERNAGPFRPHRCHPPLTTSSLTPRCAGAARCLGRHVGHGEGAVWVAGAGGASGVSGGQRGLHETGTGTSGAPFFPQPDQGGGARQLFRSPLNGCTCCFAAGARAAGLLPRAAARAAGRLCAAV